MFDENANKNPEKVILYFEEELWTNKQVGPHCEVKDLNLVYFAIWQSIAHRALLYMVPLPSIHVRVVE